MRTRMSIMESALDIFSEKNFANASVSEITSRIGLSKGAFYWHFKNKQDILVKIVEEFCAGDCTDTMGGICGASQEAGCCTMRKYLKDVLVRLRSEERWKKLHELMIRRHEWPDDIRERVEQILHEAMLRDIKQMEAYIVNVRRPGRYASPYLRTRSRSLWSASSTDSASRSFPERCPTSSRIARTYSSTRSQRAERQAGSVKGGNPCQRGNVII